MHLLVVGISCETAPLELLERLALPCDEAARLAGELVGEWPVAEAVVLSSCERTELYMFAANAEESEPLALRCFVEIGGQNAAELRVAAYTLRDEAAIAHLFRLAAGLDSMGLGELPILEQLEAAYQAARDEGCASVVLERLFRRALEIGGCVRSETSLGEQPGSCGSAALGLACDISDLQGLVEAKDRTREQATDEAATIIADEVARMSVWLAGLEVMPTIALLRGAAEGIREAELRRRSAKLEGLTPAQGALVEQLTAAIVNKIVQLPTARMRQLATEGDAYVYADALRRLFDLDGVAPSGGCVATDVEQTPATPDGP